MPSSLENLRVSKSPFTLLRTLWDYNPFRIKNLHIYISIFIFCKFMHTLLPTIGTADAMDNKDQNLLNTIAKTFVMQLQSDYKINCT